MRTFALAAKTSEGSRSRGAPPVSTMRAPVAVQPHLKVNSPGDAFEQEADSVAAHVMNESQGSCHCGGTCPSCKSGHDHLQLKAGRAGSASAAAPPGISALTRSAGQPLDSGTRAFFEPRFGFDFSGVRVHTDHEAGDAADRLGAHAFTIGPHIAFARGEHQPQSPAGRLLLAHELTHVVQQSGGAERVSSVSGPPQVQRLVRASSVHCPAAATGIADPHTGPADRRASALLDTAITRVTNAQAARAANPADPDVVAVGNALRTAFGLDPANAATWTTPAPNVALPVILRRVQAVKAYIDSVVYTVTCIPVGGAGHTIPGCPNDHCNPGNDRAFSCSANPVELVLCPAFWAQDLDGRGRTWLHENFHIIFPFIGDWGNPNVHNAHCYSQFVMLLNGLNNPADSRCG